MTGAAAASILTAVRAPGRAPRGMLHHGTSALACALGAGGIKAVKREGDGATPLGYWRLLRVLYRADRLHRPRTALPVRRIGRDDGWCDAADDRNYNRAIRHPYSASAEHLWREDGLYDVVVVLDCNVRPRMRGRGSAIFMHVAHPGFAPTRGCVAFSRAALLRLLAHCGPGSALRVVAPYQPRAPKMAEPRRT